MQRAECLAKAEQYQCDAIGYASIAVNGLEITNDKKRRNYRL